MQKRGQVSTFLIIGIVLIIIISGYFGIQHFVLKSDYERQLDKHANVPIQVQPISQEIDTCLKEKLETAITTVGLQGGYYLPPFEELPTTPYTPLGASIPIVQNSDIRTAVWQRETPNGLQTTDIQTEKEIEEEINKYLEDNFQECIDIIEPYKEQGFSVAQTGTPQASTTITKNSVDTVVDYRFDITLKDLTFPLTSHLAQVDTQFGEMVEMAGEFMEFQEESLYLEKKTLDTMVANDNRVPFSGSSLACAQTTWTKSQVIQDLKDVLYYNTQAITITGTANEGEPFLQADALSNNHKDITGTFYYSTNWPTVIEIQVEGETLESENLGHETATLTGNILTQYFCFDNHHFVYDIKYPILIAFTDDKGYTFQFITQVIIDNNEPKENTEEILIIENQETKLCQFPTEQVDIETYTFSPTGTPITLPETKVSLKCGYTTCPLGTTNAAGLLRTQAPQCMNGIFQAKKDGYYLGKALNIGTLEQATSTILLEPFYTKEIRIQIIDKETGEIREPYESETAFTTFEFPEAAYSATTDGATTVELIAGDYTITSMVTGESTWPITVPKTSVQHCTNTKGLGIASFFAQPEQCFTTETESFELDMVLKGGVKYDFTLDRSTLASPDPLYVYVPAEAITTDMEELAQRQINMETNSEDPAFMLPHL